MKKIEIKKVILIKGLFWPAIYILATFRLTLVSFDSTVYATT